MKTKIDRVTMDNVWGEYGPLICDGCKEAMKPLGQKIADRLNKGKQPRMRDVIKLQSSLCPSCFKKVYAKKVGR